jgi:hypothetical protein
VLLVHEPGGDLTVTVQERPGAVLAWVRASRVDVVVAADGTANFWLSLQDEHRPALVEQGVGRDQSVGAGADDDGVEHRLTHGTRRISPSLGVRR